MLATYARPPLKVESRSPSFSAPSVNDVEGKIEVNVSQTPTGRKSNFCESSFPNQSAAALPSVWPLMRLEAAPYIMHQYDCRIRLESVRIELEFLEGRGFDLD